MTGYQSKKEAASAKTIDKVNWADHEPNGLAQPAQEPWPEEPFGHMAGGVQPAQEPQICCGEYDTCLRACTPRGRYLAQPAQEPVQWCSLCGRDIPLQRTWVGLTDEDIALIDWESLITKKDCVQAIEAKLKERNA